MAIDKAEWQYDSAMKGYCEATGKQQEELTSADENTIWEREYHLVFGGN